MQEIPAFPSQGQVRAFSWLVNLVNAITLDMRSFVEMWHLNFIVVLAKNMKDMWWGFDALGALVERWHPHTHTFVFQGFEASVLLEEVELFLGWQRCLEYDVATPLLSWEEILADIVRDKKEVLRMTNKNGIFLDRLAWWLIQHAREIGGERATRGLTLCLAGVFLFPTSGDFILYEHVGVLSLLWRGQSLAPAVLAHLYSSLTTMSQGGRTCGSLFLLQGKGRMRSRVTWDLCWAWYRALPEVQQTRIARMGFGHILSVRPFHVDVPYLEALRERWEEDCKAFIMPWGHMIPTLKDVAYLTGLPVQGEPVVRLERRDYYDDIVELLGPEFVAGRRRPIRSILLGSLSEAVGLRGRRRGPLESLDEFCTGVRGALDLGDRSEERSIRIFVSYLLERLLFATQSSQMNCKFVLLLSDLAQAGRYAWGTVMLGHLFSLLPSSSQRSQSTGGFTPFLQILGYTRFPMGRGTLVEGRQTMVPLMTRWEMAPDPKVTDRRVGDVRVALDHYPHEQVVWTPYAGEADASHPAVAAGRPLFDRHLLLLCLGTCEVLYLELVVRTLGWHQPAIEVPSLGREGHSRRRFFAEDRDWGADHGNTVAYWREGGEQVVQ
ncbi:hypothetical protein Taro_007515 [Colocasia esculenta]|uniref:Aminotransferase-like plant mobile domain-containing protein n=1 Tax=Colocasia esculenta TaxID=4460 RepID=A0A843TV95_COLES|nr:hypothetical protein [Colocasia esculenta]